MQFKHQFFISLKEILNQMTYQGALVLQQASTVRQQWVVQAQVPHTSTPHLLLSPHSLLPHTWRLYSRYLSGLNAPEASISSSGVSAGPPLR